MKNLVSKENNAATLALIGVDKAASCIDITAAQEFDIKMEKDSSDKESDGVPSDQDLEDDEKVSLLSDEEDKETAVSKENNAATLALIGVDKAASCIDITAAQEFDIKMEKDSSDKESDGVPSDQNLEDDEKVSLLSDEEDKETAVSKENNAATLALIGVDKAASCIDITAAQEFDIKMEKDSSDKESDGVPSDQDLEDDEKVSLLSDEEDKETAVSKENNAATLALIGVDKAASCIDITAAQEFDIKMEKDSSDKESDGVPSDQDLEDDEKVSLLSDEEDKETASVEATVDKAVEGEETASVEATVDKAVEGEVTQALKPDRSTEDNLDEAHDDEDFIPSGKKKEHQKHDIQPNPVPEMDQSVLILQFLQLDERRKVRQTMCLSKLCSKA